MPLSMRSLRLSRVAARKGLLQSSHPLQARQLRALYVIPRNNRPTLGASIATRPCRQNLPNWPRVAADKPSNARHASSESKPLVPSGKQVSSTSSTRSITGEIGQQSQSQLPGPNRDVDMAKALKSDFVRNSVLFNIF
jgi:hypothetical protein